MKKILGLDLGTNSIGWALVNEAEGNGEMSLAGIEAAGCRIIPMSADQLGEFERGNSVSGTRERTAFRGTRRLRERFLLRRERLNRVLKCMGFLPEHYASCIDEYGKFHRGTEPKIEWVKGEDGKYEFIFPDTFNQMLDAFKFAHPESMSDRMIPADWTLYYLRKKALTQKISKEELAWILLNFNQKRGYYQLRGEEDEEDLTKKVEYMKLDVLSVEDTGSRKGKGVWYNIHLSNGLVYKRLSEQQLDWAGKSKEFIVTTQLASDGSVKLDKDGEPKINIRMPNEDDWTLLKKRTETDIETSGKTVGEYIFDNILSNPDIKVVGKLVRTVERKFYRSELKRILTVQTQFHPELSDYNLYESCIELLYPNNEAYRNSIATKGFVYLLADDIIFYQRPLRSQKHLICNCPYESRKFVDSQTGEVKTSYVKCISKSNPIFQEFRIWQFLANLKIYSNDGSNKDVTRQYLETVNDWARLYEWLDDRKEIDQATLLSKYFGIKKVEERFPIRWNYVEDKKYPCNKTKSVIAVKLSGAERAKLTPDLIFKIWHLLYSVKTKEEIDSVFSDSKIGRGGILDELLAHFSVDTVNKLKSVKFEEEDYGSYSEKAIKKLLSLMRAGRYWDEAVIESSVKDRIEKLLSGEYGSDIDDRLRERVAGLQSVTDFQGLPLWLACYVIYGRHSEGKEIGKWQSPEDINVYLNEFKQHSLRNPIVEQVVTETLRTVRDVWRKVGHIDEIHVELGRELKNTSEQRARTTRKIIENENANQRIRTLLKEFLNPEFDVEGVRPYSPSQQEILKIYEEGVLSSGAERSEEINDIIVRLSASEPAKRPSKSDVIKYKAWLEQNYKSPYTGQPIPLARLFTHEYEIEHIIPQSRYFDDSMQNKVICEAEVNRLKNRQLGHEFISNHHGEVVTLTGGRTVTILSVEAYEAFVKKTYAANGAKMQKLLMDDIPDEFINRQMNDTRYISKYIMSLLSNIVREELKPGEYEQGSVSKNLIVCNGSITTALKKDWGINDVWNSLILPRFIRLNELCQTTAFTTKNSEGHLIPDMPEELQKGFQKKRIDHRHHAMDAIVIACATRSHVHLLNNEAAKSENRTIRYQLSRKLRRYEKTMINGEEREIAKEFIKPWPTFTQDVKRVLEGIIVSFKQNLRVINKATNFYVSYHDESGNLRLDKSGKPIKGTVAQKSNPNWWAVRKPLHKDTVFGKVSLRKIKEVRLGVALQNPDEMVDKELKIEIKRLLSLGYDEKRIKKYFAEGDNKDIWSEFNPGKIKVYYYTDDTFAVRKSPMIFAKESPDKIRRKIEESVTDVSIQKIFLRHLEENNGDPSKAFSAEGIDAMNRNIVSLNSGKYHCPVIKFRWYESSKSKYRVGKGIASSKFVEAADGTNLYFAIYADEAGKRSFDTTPLNVVIERLKDGLGPVPEVNLAGEKLLFYLSPNDLVYVPTEDSNVSDNLCIDAIYRVVSFTNKRLYVIPYSVSKVIVDKVEFSQLNKIEFTVQKESCIPIKVDRLGKITYIGKEFLPKGGE